MIYFLNFNMESELATTVEIQIEETKPRCKRKKTRRGRKRKLNVLSTSDDTVGLATTPVKSRKREHLPWKPNLRPQTIAAPRSDDFDPVEEWYRVPNSPSSPLPPPVTDCEPISPSEYYLQMYGPDEISSSDTSPEKCQIEVFTQPLFQRLGQSQSFPINRRLSSDGESCGHSSSTSKSDCDLSVLGATSRSVNIVEKTSALNFDFENEQALLDVLHSMTKSQLIQKYFDLKNRLHSLEKQSKDLCVA
ncbi:uncharacterized protein LOC117115019 [Anneissia japonica]|uniref:uncharacterized protein LOC117115019 n=1 Tax=Anneissia japonica TaxID=1529436 RepID=UPI0014257463|nr:uncharacterized protein LOC117115019 [Anneissia japonica]